MLAPAKRQQRHPLSRRRMFAALSVSLLAACGAKPTYGAAGRRPFAGLYLCEGCDGVFERDAAGLSWRASIAGAQESGERMQIQAVVLQADGRSPAAGVVIYAYHTDASGFYSRGAPTTEWSRRHGLLRGWVRTGADGRYAFDTIKPAPYPGENLPAHVHLTVLEPGRRPYWIDDIVFAGEFGVTERYRRERENRGGNGIVTLTRENGLIVARRNIVLEPHP